MLLGGEKKKGEEEEEKKKDTELVFWPEKNSHHSGTRASYSERQMFCSKRTSPETET